MPIPEINQNQLTILEVAGKMDDEYQHTTTFWMVPDTVKDRPDEFFKFMRTQQDIDELIKLEMLIDSTQDKEYADQITAMEQANGRKFRAVSITNWGMALFGEVFQESKGIN